MTLGAIIRRRPPGEPEPDWYDERGELIVTGDDRFGNRAHDACRVRELVESLACWDDPALWQYRLDLLRSAIESEENFVHSAFGNNPIAEAIGTFLRGPIPPEQIW